MNVAVLADQHPAGDRALYEGGTWFTWGEVRRRARAVAEALGALGVGSDDRVAIVWPTSVDFVVAYLGVLAAGAIAVPLNPNSPPNELGRELKVVEPTVMLAAGEAGAVSTVPHVVLPARVVATMGAKVAQAKVWEEFSAAGDQACPGDGAGHPRAEGGGASRRRRAPDGPGPHRRRRGRR